MGSRATSRNANGDWIKSGKELKSNLVMVTILSKREHEEKENESHRV